MNRPAPAVILLQYCDQHAPKQQRKSSATHQRQCGGTKVMLLRGWPRKYSGEGEALGGEGLEDPEAGRANVSSTCSQNRRAAPRNSACLSGATLSRQMQEFFESSCHRPYRLALAGGSIASSTSDVALMASSILSAGTPTPFTEDGRILTYTCAR